MSELCRKGTYNPGGNRDPCHECGTGLTTKTSLIDDSGAVSQAECVAEPGFQVVDGEASECAQGTYNDGTSSNCTACSPGFTTESTGATSCDMCLPGHCGADCAAATSSFFSPGGLAADSACTACPPSTDFVLQFPGIAEEDLVYTAPTISAAASPSRLHCVAAFAQLSNAAPLEAATGVAIEPGVSSLGSCVTACSSVACQFLSFDYGSRTCSIRTGTPGKNAADNLFYVLAFKQVNAGSAGANSIANAASPGSGFFTFYEDSTAKDVAGLAAAPEGTTTQQQCLAACTMDEACAAVLITQSGDAARSFISCGLIRPLAVPNGQVRSLIRADPAKASLESLTAGAGGAAGGGQQTTGTWVSPVGRCPSVVSTIVGGPTHGQPGGDGGPATSATLVDPASLVYDSHGNMFILDREASQVRRVDAITGIITTLAITYPPYGYSLYGPRKMDIDGNDNLYIAANAHSSIVKIAPNGSTSLAAGTGTPGYNGDGILATAAQLNYPDAVAVDAEGNLYISDSGNSRIRRVDAKTGIITTIAGNGGSCNAVPTTGEAVPALTTCIGWTWALGVSPDGKTVWFDLKNNYLFQLKDGAISAINYVGGEITYLRPDPAGKLHYTVFNSRCVIRYDGGSSFTRVAGFCNDPAPDPDGKDALDTHFLGYRMSLLWHDNTLLIGELDYPWGVGVGRVRKITYNC